MPLLAEKQSPLSLFPRFKQQVCEKLVQEQSLTWCKIKKETIQRSKGKWEKLKIEVGLRFKNGYHIHTLKVISTPSQHFHCDVVKIKKTAKDEVNILFLPRLGC